MSGVARKCKGCGLPVKGHQGPTGVGKCRRQQRAAEVSEVGQQGAADNQPGAAEVGEAGGELVMEQEVADLGGELPVSLEENHDQDEKEDQQEVQSADAPNSHEAKAKKDSVKKKTTIKKKSKSKGKESVTESNSPTGLKGVEGGLGRDATLHEESEDNSGVVRNGVLEDHFDRADQDVVEGEVDAPGKDGVEAEDEEQECNNSDSDDTEASHFLPSKKVNLVGQVAKIGAMDSLPEETEVQVTSKKIDVKELVRGKTFLICLCEEEGEEGEQEECDCEGVFKVTEELGGVVLNAYMDPLSDYEVDFSPKLSFAKTTGWKKTEPNVIKFKFGGVKAPGVKSSKGEILLTASEVLNNDGSPGIVIRANMDLQLGVSKHYTEVGFKNPLKFKSIECNLLLETVRGKDNSTGGENAREDRGSQTEEEELS